jgi:hypothetical protein
VAGAGQPLGAGAADAGRAARDQDGLRRHARTLIDTPRLLVALVAWAALVGLFALLGLV